MAKWICHPEDNRESRLVPVFRRKFSVGPKLKEAKLRISSHGLYEAELNGVAVTQNKFTPGFTSYYHRIQVQEYEISKLIKTGMNEIRVTVGDGWWRWNNNFGYTMALWCELILEYENTTEIIESDENFEVSVGPVIKTDLQKGELYDARVKPEKWQKARVCCENTQGRLIATEGVPIREHEEFEGKPFRDNSGNLVIDFGQNISGYVKMKLFDTYPGQVVHLKHGEGLDLNGNFSTSNCDAGKPEFQEITYICCGAKIEEYKPRFAVFGFRYILVEGVEKADKENEHYRNSQVKIKGLLQT